MLQEFGPSLYTADGPTVSFFGFPYPTRMAAARLTNGDVWIWSPIALTQELAHDVQSLGQVRYIVSPNKLHHIGDLIQRFTEADMSGWKGLVMRLGGLTGERGSTARDWRASFLRHGPARAALQKVLAWNPERLLIAHGSCAQTGAAKIVASALSWI